MLLAGKVAVVTGGARALGLAMAQAMAQQGARLMLVGRDTEALRAATSAVRDAGGEADHVTIDVTEVDAPDKIIEATHQAYKAIDTWINSAGVFAIQDIASVTHESWHRTVDTNLTAPFMCAQAFVRYRTMHSRGGSIINIGSVHGALGDAQAIPQCASKHGVVGLTRALAEACRAYGIRVNAIAPGAITPQSADRLSIDTGTLITQGDVAQLAVYLASDLASAITGAVVDVFGVTRPVIANG